jgi:hypothetical protein
MVPQYEEAKLESTPEKVAAEEEVKEFIAKFMGLIHEMEANLTAVEEAPRAVSEGEGAGGGRESRR